MGGLRLASDHIDLYVAKIARHRRCTRRDTTLLLTLFSTAAKPLEIAQLEVATFSQNRAVSGRIQQSGRILR
jgi:hypothetical protein